MRLLQNKASAAFKHKHVGLALILSFALAQNGHAQEAKGFTVKECIDYAMQNQSKVLNAQLDEQIAHGKVQEVIASGLPQLNGSVDVKNFIEIPTSLIPAEFFKGNPGEFIPVKFGTKYNSTASLDASQLLFDGSYIVGLQATKTYQELARKNAQRSKIETAIAVEKAYYTTLVVQLQRSFMDALVLQLKKVLDDTKVAYDNGVVEKLDADRRQLSYNNILVDQQNLQYQAQLAMYALKFQMGMDLTSNIVLSDKIEDIGLAPLATLDSPFDYTNRIEYSLAQLQKRGAELMLKKDRFAYMPTVVAFASLSTSALRSTFDFTHNNMKWYPTALVGGKLILPIFSSGQKHFRVNQSKLSLQKAENDVKLLGQALSLEQASARVRYQNAVLSMNAQKQNMALAQQVYEVSKIKYQEGVGSNLELLDAETQLKSAQNNYYNAVNQSLMAKIDMEQSKGNYEIK